MDNQTMTCDHCTKEDCKDCVSHDGKNFCCEKCCDDYKERQEAPKKEAPNVCKFC